jgi:phosphate transport system substrate-binding protein
MRRLALSIICCLLLVGTASIVAAGTELLGAGATFPQPLYSKMFDAYYKGFGVKVNYQGIGSGAGIEQLKNKTVDFGATDAFMKDNELKAAPAKVLHVPIALGAVAVTYNLPGNPQIKLSRNALADVFLGKIKKWNDPALAALNPGVKLPALPITVIHRSDGSGTTAVFTDYLAKISPQWKKEVGAAKEVKWPRGGLGAKGNPGVAGQVKQLIGSIGYVELVYALENNMATALIENKAGGYIKPTLSSTKAAADAAIPEDTRLSLTDTDAPKGYPIASLTWIIVYQEQGYGGRSRDKAQALVDLLWWMTHDGQKYCEALNYAPITKSAVEKAERIIKSITYGSAPLKK